MQPERIDNTPLWQRRPAYLSTAIKATYDELVSTPVVNDHVSSYFKEGSKKYTFGNIDTDFILTTMLEKNEGPLEVLDIGTASGLFIRHNSSKLGSRINFYGISAHNYKTLINQPGVNYRIADVHNINKIFNSNSMDLIVSRKCFTHIVDPLGSLCQVYELLRDNGLLIIDDFNIIGLENVLPLLLESLNSSGYQIVAEYMYRFRNGAARIVGIERLALRKTKMQLDLPLDYSGIQGNGELHNPRRAIYKPNRYFSETFPPYFPKTLLMVIEKYGQIIFDNKNELFLFQDFLELHFDQNTQARCHNELDTRALSDSDRAKMIEVISLIPQIRAECDIYHTKIDNSFTNICT